MNRLFVLMMALLAAPAALAQPSATVEAAPTPADVSLQEAYKREFAFLAGLKTQLERRRDAVSQQNAAELAKLDADVSTLEDRYLATQTRVDTLKEQLAVASQRSPTEDRDLVESTLAQARVTLGEYDVEIPEPSDDQPREALIQQVADESVALLNRLGSVHSEPGAFFAKDGTKVEGTIVRVGRVAAFGTSESAAGALIPAGGGFMKVWRDSGEDDARALARGERPERLSIFLVESMSERVDDSAGQSAFEHVDSGGVIGWIIVGLGLLGGLMALVRAALLLRASGSTASLENKVGTLARSGDLAGATQLAKSARGSAARVLATVLPNLQRGVQDVEDLVAESLLVEGRNLNRFATLILVIAAVAPLLGLLGTVTGMIATFDVITKYGSGDPKMLSGGISVALVTTELGLIVAIPTLLIGNLLKGWADKIERGVEHAVLNVVNQHRDAQSTAE